MSGERWSDIIGRLTRAAPVSIDDLADAVRPRDGGGRDVLPAVEAVLMPSAPMRQPDAVAVGYRVTEPLADAADRALRLASFALEKDAEIIILSHLDESGFERFGFRVERVVGEDADARAACEEQLRRFWNIDLVL